MSEAMKHMRLTDVQVGPKPPTFNEIDIVPSETMQQLHSMHNRPYTICMVLRELYVAIDDPEVRKKLQYATTLAEYVCTRLWQLDPEWLRGLYPRRKYFERLMKRAK